MSNRKSQSKAREHRVIPMRSAGERVINNSDSPSKSLFEDFKKQVEAEQNPSSTSITSTPSNTSRTSITKQQPIAPERDFQKIPNSITRVAIPSGYFRGKSKQVYDYLYSVTRGSFPAARITFKTRREIMKGSGIGSMVTVDASLAHLSNIGLIKSNSAVGSASGNEYEVLMPEEIIATSSSSIPSTTSSTTSTSGLTSSTHNMEELVVPVSGITSTTQTIDNTDDYSQLKTLIKTNEENDDERLRAAFGEFEIILDQAIKKHTGKGISSGDKMRWKHVAEVLVAQIELIASRTTISNGPAVLAEHLQRHLNNKRVLEKMGLITPAQAKEMKEPVSKKQEIPFLFLCPDCRGTRMWNPDGKGMRPNCPHMKLEAAIKKAKDDGEI